MDTSSPPAEPLLVDIPQALHSDRLFMRTPTPGDGALILPAVRESLPELKPWMPWATDNYDLASAEQWCRRTIAAFHLRQVVPYLLFF